MTKILLIGESWITHTIHVKGFDTMTTSKYGEGTKWIKSAIEQGGFDLSYIASHKVDDKFPNSKEELNKYDLIILSDIGSNSLLLSEKTFDKGEIDINRCKMIEEFVLEGGSFIMIGGYMSFTGIDGTARYGKTDIANILPVELLDTDDRIEFPEGITPKIIEKDHKIFNGIDKEWPYFLGYNKTILKEGAKLIASINGDPFIAYKDFGKGRSFVFTSDFAPHWAPKEFIEWEYYNKFWINVINFLDI